MPNMNGFELSERILAMDMMASVAIIVGMIPVSIVWVAVAGNVRYFWDYEKYIRYFWDGGIMCNTPLTQLVRLHRLIG